jgi:hypothetical protein
MVAFFVVRIPVDYFSAALGCLPSQSRSISPL